MAVFEADRSTAQGDAPWVIVAAGFHQNGGMDKANAALATRLMQRGVPVHIVAHTVDDALCAGNPRATVHLVPRPLGSLFLGEWFLERAGRRVAREVTAAAPLARVVVNGGNCMWADLNWVHYVHRAAGCYDRGAPWWFRAKYRVVRRVSRLRERRVLPRARMLFANSERTRADLIQRLGLPAERIRTVYLGAEPSWGPATVDERRDARAWLGVKRGRYVAVFLGALGYDRRKGLDTLLEAWQRLAVRPGWDVELIVAGAGRGLAQSRQWVAQAGLEDHVQFIGFTNRVKDLLAAADVVVSPTRYESYGMNVQEAVCRGVPAIVSADAGVSEHFLDRARQLLITDPEDVDELVDRLNGWRADPTAWREEFARMSERVRRHDWSAMSDAMIAAARES